MSTNPLTGASTCGDDLDGYYPVRFHNKLYLSYRSREVVCSNTKLPIQLKQSPMHLRWFSAFAHIFVASTGQAHYVTYIVGTYRYWTKYLTLAIFFLKILTAA